VLHKPGGRLMGHDEEVSSPDVRVEGNEHTSEHIDGYMRRYAYIEAYIYTYVQE